MPPSDEFSAIPGPPARRRTRHPVIALAVVVLAGFLIYQVRADLGYALCGDVPVDLGTARALSATPISALPIDRVVRLSGTPDRESAVLLDRQGSWEFTQFFRLLGSNGRVFVQRAADPLPLDKAERDDFVGRLVPLSRLPFFAAIRQHFAFHVSATHFFRSAPFIAAIGSGGRESLTTDDYHGARVSIGPRDDIVLLAGQAGQVAVSMPKSRFPDVVKAQALLLGTGARVVSAIAAAASNQPHEFVVETPGMRRDAILSSIGDLDRQVRIRPARRAHRARLGELSVSAAGVVIAAPSAPAITLPLADIESIRSVAAVQIPADAVLLLEGDKPRNHLWTVMLVACLLAFALVNLLALRPAR